MSLDKARPIFPRLKTACVAVILFVANLWIARTLLWSEFINQMYSIEGTHIALGRYILEHWPDLHWFPLWYGGMPFQNAYPVLHPFLVAAVAGVSGFSTPHAYHFLTAIFYALGPVTLFLLAFKLSGSRWYGGAAALIYSFSSPSALLIVGVSRDVGGVWHARRLQALVQYGEGPHIASMALFPLALLILILAFEKRKPLWWGLASLALVATVLTNWLGAFTLALAVMAWLLISNCPAGRRKWMIAAGLGLWAYAIACPWIPPSTILTTLGGEALAGGSAELLGRTPAILVGVLAYLALYVLLRITRAPLALAFSVLFLFPAAYLTLAQGWSGLSILHQASRMHLEMEMGIALVVSFGAKALLDLAPQRLRVAAAVLIVLAGGYGAIRLSAYAGRLYRPIDVKQTIEYREAKWVSGNLNGHRVLLPGSVGFFLNVFSDTPQLDGGYYQGMQNQYVAHVNYQIHTGDNAGPEEGVVAAAWLKAFGVDAVGVSGPQSEEPYKPFRNPRKFDGVLPEIWRQGDDVIYRVPRRSQSLAHVIRPADLPVRVPVSALDVEAIHPYLRALDDPNLPEAPMRWLDQRTASISTQLKRDQILSIQVSYHPGWEATVNGRTCRVGKDNLGQLAVFPDCEGPCAVRIAYYGGTEMLAASAVCWSSLLGGLAWILLHGLASRAARRRGGCAREVKVT
ncbi:MAG: hypothetical protein LLG20_26995 [Acidobacteriales bacterium]|nr:hypothetical protein [Terriglobales bacterium]